MASAVDPTSSLGTSRPSRNLPASWSHIAAAAPAPAPAAPLADPIPSRDSSERSLQKSPSESHSPPPSESPDHAIDGNAVAAASRGKKTVWNVPSNGSSEGGAVMDAAYWPALSESARASQKSSSSDSLKGLSDASISVHLGSCSPISKPASSNPNPRLASSPSSSARHKTMKHVATNVVFDTSSGGGGLPNGGVATPSPLPASSQISQPVPDRQPSPKGLTNKNSNNNHNWDNSSRASGVSHQTHGGNDYHRGYGGGRRGNNGQHNSYGNRRDPERGGYEWNHRNFVRDVHVPQLHPQWGVRPYSRPPPVAAQLIVPPPPPPPRPFSHNMGFHVSMLMFSTFEHSVDFLYRKIIQKKREECSRAQQLGITCIAGYTSGAIGTIISTPADNIIASLYNKKAHNVQQAVKSIGFPKLFTRSLPVRIALVGPVVTLQWFFYDSIKLLTGLPTSGGIVGDRN